MSQTWGYPEAHTRASMSTNYPRGHWASPPRAAWLRSPTPLRSLRRSSAAAVSSEWFNTLGSPRTLAFPSKLLAHQQASVTVLRFPHKVASVCRANCQCASQWQSTGSFGSPVRPSRPTKLIVSKPRMADRMSKHLIERHSLGVPSGGAKPQLHISPTSNSVG